MHQAGAFNIGSNASPGGEHSEGHRTNRRRFSDIRKSGYEWIKKRLPTPGTGNYAFETLGLVEFSPIGPGVIARDFLAVLQPPQQYFPAQQLLTTGLGGIVPGQVIMQPLLDPYSGTFGGEPIV